MNIIIYGFDFTKEIIFNIIYDILRIQVRYYRICDIYCLADNQYNR